MASDKSAITLPRQPAVSTADGRAEPGTPQARNNRRSE
jgi:hypothetical protein